MAAPLKYFLDGTSPLWLSAGLVGKPAAVFTSSSSTHGGQETTLVSMMLPLMHHGMVIVGLPYTEAALYAHYGRRHALWRQPCCWCQQRRADRARRKELCQALGSRLATVALLLSREAG